MDSASTSNREVSLPSSMAGLEIDNQIINKGQTNAGRALCGSSPWSDVVRGQSASESSSSASNSCINFDSLERHRQSEPSCSPNMSSDGSENTNNDFNVPASPARLDDLTPPSTSSDGSERAPGDGSSSKKPAWKKPAGESAEAGAVMGADSWPALSDCRIGKTLDLSKPPAEGSAPQGSTLVPAPQKAAGNPNPGVTQNQVVPNRQKSSGKRGGPPNGILPQFVSSETPLPLQVQDRFLAVSDFVYPEPARKGNGESGIRNFMPASANTEQHRHHYQRGNGSNNSYSNNYGNRRNVREPGRFNHELNFHRNFNVRGNINMQHRVGPRNYFRPPPPPYISPVRGFTNPMSFPAGPMYYIPTGPLESVRGVPYFPPAPPPGVFIPGPDPNLRAMLAKQIDYYFSVENLCKDTFLREKMDEHGWVPVSLIANFNRVRQMTSNVALIIDVLRNSTVVEVQGDKIRKREDWSNWVLPRGIYYSVSNTQHQGVSGEDKSTSDIKHAVLNGRFKGDLLTKHATGQKGLELEDSNGQMSVLGKRLEGSCHGKDPVQTRSSSSEAGSDLCTSERESSVQGIVDQLLDVRINHRD